MRTDALIGLIAVCAIGIPLIASIFLRRRVGLSDLPVRLWLALYATAFLLQPVFLVRKLWEGALILNDPSPGMMALAQIDNAWWEELAKLLAIVIVIWIARDRLMPRLRQLPSAISVGYWAGLAYGAGEAVVLAILFTFPSLGPIFGMHTFTPFTLGWEFVYERAWAMQLHAIMGALIGIGVWSWIGGRRWALAGWFVAAMLYHHLVDGSIILAGYVSEVAALLSALGMWALPVFVGIGYGIIVLAYRSFNRKASPIIHTR